MAKKKLSDQQVQSIAESLLPTFISKDDTETSLTFNFTAEGLHYKVDFKKEGKNWLYKGFSEQFDEEH